MSMVVMELLQRLVVQRLVAQRLVAQRVMVAQRVAAALYIMASARRQKAAPHLVALILAGCGIRWSLAVRYPSGSNSSDSTRMCALASRVRFSSVSTRELSPTSDQHASSRRQLIKPSVCVCMSPVLQVR